LLGTATLGADGKATITVPAKTLPVGSKSLTMVYSGDSTHLGSTGTLTVTTAKAASSTNAPDVNVIAGGHGTVTVTVTADNVIPTGTITLKNGATVIASSSLLGGQASFNLPVLPDGTTLTAEYAGDENVTPSSDTFTIHVGKATPIVNAGDVDGVVGAPVTVTVNVVAPAGITPSGTVTIRNGGTTLGTGTVSGGVASIVIAGGLLPAGVTSLTAEYGGDGNLGAGTDSFTAQMSKAGSSVSADTKPNHPTKKQKVKLTVKVDGDNGIEATGKVKIKVEGDTMTAVLDNGQVKVNLGKFGRGTHKVKVIYLGSASLEGSETTEKFTVI
jgi:Bacterial Ig-like domain (group 3)